MEYDLVFEGGGAKGMVFVGAMQEFESRGHTHKRLLGTSAGAITASLLAAGYSSQEMLQALAETENGHSVFNGFLARPGPWEKAQVVKSATLAFLDNVNLPFIPDLIEKKVDMMIVDWLSNDPQMSSIYSLLEFGGWFSADQFVAWMKRRLDTGEYKGQPRHFSDMNLQQFFDATQTELSVVASDTTAGEMLVLNHRTAPKVPLVWAVRMSMSIPLLWQEVTWKEEWGSYRDRPMTGHAIVDGGMLSNFPIELFISQDDFIKSIMGPVSGPAVMGMMIDESMEVPDAPAPVLAAPPPPGSVTTVLSNTLVKAPLWLRINNLLNTTLSARDKMVAESVEKMVVRLPAKSYGTTEFDMTDQRRGALVSAGCATMKTYLDSLEVQQAAADAVAFDIDASQEQAAEEERAQKHSDKIARKIFK